MIELSTGEKWLVRATRPIVARTAVNASRIGTLAATSAPNAINRITSVIGSEVTNARLEILADRIVELLADARIADLLDGETWIGGLGGGGGLERRSDPIRRLGLVTGDLEAKQGRMPVS